jgi:hypothetical protein
MAIMTPQQLIEMQNRFPRGRSPFGSSCPALNEEVLLADKSWILAKDLKVGDEVATHLGSNKVTYIDILKDRTQKEVIFTNGEKENSIVTSDTHPYYVENEQGFVEVKDLKIGDKVGEFLVKEIKDAGKGSVAHISIDEAQTYFLKAGDEAVLSHNKRPALPKTPVTPRVPTINIPNLPNINLPNIDFSKIPQGIRIPNIPNIPAPIKTMPAGGIGGLLGGRGGLFGNIRDRIKERIQDIQGKENFAIDSVTGEVIPQEDVILRPMPVEQATTVEPIALPPAQTIAETPAQTVAEATVPATTSESITTTPTQAGQTISSPTMSDEGAPFVSGATRVETGIDPLTRQLLFGLDGRGGFIPGAFKAAEKVFFTPEGEARVIPEEIAGFSPEQQAAFELAAQTGTQQPFIGGALGAYGAGLGSLMRGLGEAGQIARGATGLYGMGLQDPEALLRATLGGYDPRMTQMFMDPFEQQVVQQTIQDIMERGEQADIAARASDIARGGESAFGSRARLMAGERERALGRGLGEAIGGLRSAGFQRAQQTGMGEFARQLEAQRQAASGLAGLAGQRLGAQQQLGQTLAGLGSTQQQALSQAGQQALGAQQAMAGARSNLAGLQQQIAGQLQAGQFGAGQALAGLGAQAQAAQQADISQLLGVGAQQQQQQQAILDAQRRAALQAQQAPLAQYQSLLPFVQQVPAGQQQVTTTFAPPPSPLQAGLMTGLAGLGALGQFLNPQQRTI